MNIDEQFWSRVQKTDTCWFWVGTVNKGYGQFSIGSFSETRRRVRAHRWLWERLFGPIPTGLQIDHLCANRHCVRPDHLEVVTNQVNNQRGTRPDERRADNSSGFQGVHLFRNKKTGWQAWAASVGVSGKQIHLGYFRYREAAAMAYNVAAFKYFGPSFRGYNVVEMG
jgi:HNH endonuclease